MTQLGLFDRPAAPARRHTPRTGAELMDAGLDMAERTRRELVSLARGAAEVAALHSPDQTASADDVADGLARLGLSMSDLGPAAGAVFRGERWEFHAWRPSRRPSNHARAVRVWRLRGA